MPPLKSVTDILCQLIAIPSVNPMGREVTGEIYFEHRLSDWLVEFFHSLDVPYERIEVAPGRANVIARYNSPDARCTLLLDAHQDTVPVEGMTIPPFEPRVHDGRVTGRGACDVKGGLAAMLFAFRRLVLERPAGAANVLMSCTCDEEATTIGINDLVRCWQQPSARSRLITAAPNCAVIAEPTGLDVVVAHRGVCRFKVRTAGRACHSSEPSQGVNAIYRMARVVSCLEEYAASLAATIAPHPLCGGATLSVGRIEGGTSVNIVPDACVIEVDRRVIPGEDRSTIVDGIRDYLARHLDFDVVCDTPWLESHPLSDADNGWLADAVLAAVLPIDGPHRAVGVPYGTHASRTCAGGVPSIVFGPGDIAQAHTKDEYIEVDQLEKAAATYYDLAIALPEQLG